MIPYGRQDINQADIEAVVDVLKSDFLTQGPAVPAFETAVLDHCHAKFAVAVNSATSALHLACMALGVGEGDLVWTSPITFVASANCGLYCGAKVDFVDIDPLTWNMDVEALAAKLVEAERVGQLPKVVIPVHFAGQPCDMAGIHALSQKYGFRIIEDASHAIGARYKQQPVGACEYSDITVFSFHPVKIITTAEGGMATTNNAALASRMRLLRSHGITRDNAEMHGLSHGPWYYEQIELGFNYRMTDVQAALGLSQMQRLNAFIARRHEIVVRYQKSLDSLPVESQAQLVDSFSAYHLYVIRLQLDKLRKTHLEVFNAMREAGILVNLHYIPVYLQPYYQKMGFKSGYCPQAESYYAAAISLPMYAALTDEQQDKVVTTLTQILES